MLNDESLIERVIAALLKNEIFDKVRNYFNKMYYSKYFKAGEIYEVIKKNEDAMKCYKQGHFFNRAIQVSFCH